MNGIDIFYENNMFRKYSTCPHAASMILLHG